MLILKNYIIYISFFFLFIFSLLNFFMFLFFLDNDLVYFIEWELISLNSISLVFSILLDWISLLFMSFVFFISSVVIYYSKGYMSSEININRFIILVLLFVISMMFLIISPNIISILLGCDGLGLVSYCLVVYYQNEKSYNAGMLTVLLNRVGDVCIMMVIVWMLNYGSWNYIFYLEFMYNDMMMNYIMGLIVLAAMTKSAQIPFSAWLPAAMAAPTPVSSLVHSSTLVTAGVYLMIRFNFLLVNSLFFKILLIFSGLTMFMAGIVANYEFDLKKIIALSTLSQLGLMMSILSMGFYDLALFHLLTHAMFKALLFMSAGAIIHIVNSNQDIRYMGGMSMFIPLISMSFLISNMALCGIPFLSGFYSKDMILDMVSLSNLNMLVFFLYYLSTGLTMFYTIRLIFYLMINDFNLVNVYNFFEDLYMVKSMILLLMMAVISGSMLNWFMFLYPYMIFLPLSLKLMVLNVSIIGGIMGYVISNMTIYSLNKFVFSYKLSFFFFYMWYIPSLTIYSMNYYYLSFFYNLLKMIDYGWSEFYSGYGMSLVLKNYSKLYFFFRINNFKIYLFRFFFLIMFYLFNFVMSL
uniref:NADH-ubiquinone oxidoreductase chain 5 n=1 Tax=Acanthopsyche nigraplaga TaxID=1765094 RepID=A0A891GU60_9NEOP|nr:NADH dehydrogenase subunit 5 [Acanthopsyche nigraplaga]QRK25810.1 NADH dehydrogenase subunit 5 [Acanthopsyche nigraplaga]